MKRVNIFLLSFLALTACQKDKGALLAECKNEIILHKIDDLNADKYISNCMRAKGYDWELNCSTGVKSWNYEQCYHAK